MKLIGIFPLLLFAAAVVAQDLPPVSAASDYARLHVGLSSPELQHSIDPEYTPQALQAAIEGSVVLEAVISLEGKVAYATVLSPLPAGLDRKALEAVKHWRYSAAVMDGEKVPVLMTIDVVFKLPYKPGQSAVAHQRKEFQAILNRVPAGKAPVASDLSKVEDFAAQGLLGAVGLLGQWKVRGVALPKDVTGGLADLQRAAAANDAQSLYFLGRAELAGMFVPKSDSHGWLLLRRAAFMGSAEAQQMLAEHDEHEGNLNEARWYFRMCAARASPACEYRLGKLMVSGHDGTPNDFAQGVAWLELSKEHGDPSGAKLFQESYSKLSSLQYDWVAALKPHLELRHYTGF